MKSEKFSVGSASKSFIRVMYNFNGYDFFHTGIYTCDDEELIIFCKAVSSQDIVEKVKEFIECPWNLEEPSELEKIKTVKRGNEHITDFWWCIDNTCCGDWIAILQNNQDAFLKAMLRDYKKYLSKGNDESRTKKYLKCLEQ